MGEKLWPRQIDPLYFKGEQGLGAAETSCYARCCPTYINTTVSGRQPDRSHLGDDKQHFPRNWREFTLNIAAWLSLPQSRYCSSWKIQCFWPRLHCAIHNKLVKGMFTCPQRCSCSLRHGLPSLALQCCLSWLQDKAIPAINACKCFLIIGFLRNMLECEVLSPPREVGAKGFTGSQISFLTWFNSTQCPLKVLSGSKEINKNK